MVREIINKCLIWCFAVTYRIWRKNNRDCDSRKWSNDELRRFATLFSGNVINVSAGEDGDKEGGYYRDYFDNAASYTITNYRKMTADDIELDLDTPIPPNGNLISRFDVVFSHTVLEHVYELRTAVQNLCNLSDDIVVTVVPFLQAFHHDESNYHDYWRVSPYALVHLFNEHSFKTMYISWGDDPIGNIYLFHISSKWPERWDAIKKAGARLEPFGPGYFRQMLLSNTRTCPAAMVNSLKELTRCSSGTVSGPMAERR